MMEKDIDKGGFRPPAIGADGFLTYEEMDGDQPTEALSTGRLEDVLQKLSGEADPADIFLEPDAPDAADDADSGNGEAELDLSAGEDDKASDPVRLYLRQMGRVPLLTREQEVSIAKRIENGQIRANRVISRSHKYSTTASTFASATSNPMPRQQPPRPSPSTRPGCSGEPR
jgi:hypothetical protein